jgi:hypothetical protein
LQYLVGVNISDLLEDPAGPPDFDELGGGIRAEANVNAFVARRQIAASGGDGRELRTASGYELYFGADGVAVAFVANELECQPVILRGGFIVKEINGAVVGGDDDVDAAVVIDIADGQTTA